MTFKHICEVLLWWLDDETAGCQIHYQEVVRSIPSLVFIKCLPLGWVIICGHVNQK